MLWVIGQHAAVGQASRMHTACGNMAQQQGATQAGVRPGSIPKGMHASASTAHSLVVNALQGLAPVPLWLSSSSVQQQHANMMCLPLYLFRLWLVGMQANRCCAKSAVYVCGTHTLWCVVACLHVTWQQSQLIGRCQYHSKLRVGLAGVAWSRGVIIHPVIIHPVIIQPHTFCSSAHRAPLQLLWKCCLSAIRWFYVPARVAKLAVLSRHVAVGFIMLGELCN